MFPAEFDYYKAGSVQEAIALLGELGDARLLAGGHTLLPMMKLRLAQPASLIDIGHIEELTGIQVADGKVRIGALTRHGELAASADLKQHCFLLAEAASQVGDPQVRNRGTIGGNLAHADPGSDLPAVVLALEGVLHLAGAGGERTVAASDFFVDLLMTDLKPDEIITAVELPSPEGRRGSCYLKFEHPASGYAVCGVAALIELDSDGRCAKARIALNGVTATPWMSENLNGALEGTDLKDDAVGQAVNEHLTVEEPMGDVYASGSYRTHLAKVYARRAVLTARDRAGQG